MFEPEILVCVEVFWDDIRLGGGKGFVRPSLSIQRLQASTRAPEVEVL